MTRTIRKAAGLLLAGAVALAGGCGETQSGGDEGSETHWLQHCESSADCEQGDCLCGMCTMACGSVRDCPGPLGVCQFSGNDAAGCDQNICRTAPPGSSAQALESTEHLQERNRASCDSFRLGKAVVLDDLETSQGASEPSVSVTQEHVVAERQGGFLVFRSDGGFARVDVEGDYLRRLPRPGPSTLLYDDALGLEDGSMLIAARRDAGDGSGGHAFLAKLDPQWNLVWTQETELVLTPLAGTGIEPLPDGGIMMFGATSLDQHLVEGAPADNVFWARLDADGRVLWERRAAFKELYVNPSAMLAVTGGNTVQLVIGSEVGTTLIKSDLDGQTQQRLLDPTPRVLTEGVQALPEGRLAVLLMGELWSLSTDGTPLWRHPFEDAPEAGSGQTWQPTSLAYDAARQELVVAGGLLAGRIQALDLAGELVWDLTREPWPIGVVDSSDMDKYADAYGQVAVDPLGNILARSLLPNSRISYQWVGGSVCGSQ